MKAFLKHFFLFIVSAAVFMKPMQSNVTPSNLRFQYLTTNEGLAQNTVDCIFQDSKGFMWFGTWNGLCRYDGYTFKTFQKKNSENSLPNNFVRAIAEDQTGFLRNRAVVVFG